jgi:hypothetical protein
MAGVGCFKLMSYNFTEIFKITIGNNIEGTLGSNYANLEPWALFKAKR